MTSPMRRRVVALTVGTLAFLGLWEFAPELLCAEPRAVCEAGR